RHWHVCGVEKQPPIVARGVLIDVVGAQGLDVLPDSYGIGEDDLRMALDRQRTEVRPGDVVLVRTGRMKYWPDRDRYMLNEPGLTSRPRAPAVGRAAAAASSSSPSRASTETGTGFTGGRTDGGARSAAATPARSCRIASQIGPHVRPWQRPMPTRVKLFSSW